MTNYQLGKIYKIVCNTTGLTYYGSTCEPTLARRLAGHVSNYKGWKNGTRSANLSSYQVLENDNYEIVLVELAPSKDKMELHKTERYFVENNECINTRVPMRTQAESNLVNRENILKSRAEYRLINKDILIIRGAEWYLKNKDKLKTKHAEYYLKNREIAKIKRAEYYLKNKDITKTKDAEYRLKNKDIIKKKRAENYLKKKDKKMADLNV